MDGTRRRRRRKNADVGVATVCHVQLGRRWFSVYDVLRCRQIHIVELTAGSKADTVRARSGLALDLPADGNQECRKNAVMQSRMETVRRLQSDSPQEQETAALEIRTAARRDGEARTMLALMGSIPPLVAMLDSKHFLSAMFALVNLAVRNDANKAAIVAAGAVPKMLRLCTENSLPQTIETSAAALLSLSALDSNKSSLHVAAGMLITAVNSTEVSEQARRDAMGAVYNLSLFPGNAAHLCEAGVVPSLLSAVYDPELCSRAVATAANLVSTSVGRKALLQTENAALVFVEVLNWCRCGPPTGLSPYRAAHRGSLVDRAVYVVMVLAQHSAAQRRAMIRAGSTSVLLEIVLVGSPAGQDRASKALQFLEYRQEYSSDEQSESSKEYSGEYNEIEKYSEERRAVNRLVEQSLRMNMQRITRRACIPFHSSPSDCSSLRPSALV